MEECPTEIHILVCQSLSSGDIARLSHASRLYCEIFELILYRLYALAPEQSAVAWAVDYVVPDQPVTRKRALAILDKVKRFSLIKPGALDVAYGSLNLHPDQYWQPGFGSYASLYAASQSLREQILSFRHSSSGTDSRSLEKVVLPLKDAFFGVWTPLHLAAWKGLDEAVEWLVSNGASVDVSMIKGAMITPVLVSVIRNNMSTTTLLLAHDASPNLQTEDQVQDAKERERGKKDRKPLTIVHVAIALGFSDMVQQLLATGQIQSDPTDLLIRYGEPGTRESSTVVALLVSHQAKVSDDLFFSFLHGFKWQSALELVRSTRYRDEMSPQRASDLIRDLLASRRLGQYTDTAENIIQQLLNLGADWNLGQLLWARSNGLKYRTMLQILHPFLAAGMEFEPSTRCRRQQHPSLDSPEYGQRPGIILQRRFDFLNIQDLFGNTTALRQGSG